MDISKREFGRFVIARRRAAGLTQRELAVRLHVTESAVSKWERGLSYPDITMVQALATELGVSAQELISASEDREGRAAQRDARAYRGWRRALLWSTAGLYAVTLLTCVIVNLSVSHTLDWFWTVLPAVALAASLTTLPLLRIPHRGWWTLGAALASLCALLFVVWLQYGGGTWIWIALASTLFGVLLVFTPLVLRVARLPEPLARHRTVLSLLVSTVGLVLLLGVIALALGRPELWGSLMLPLAAMGALPAWLIALSVRYLPGPWPVRAAAVSAVLGAAVPFVDRVVDQVLGEPWSWTPNLAVWDASTMNSNITLLLILAAAVATVGFSAAALLGRKRPDSALADAA